MSRPAVTVLDIGMGNLASVVRAFERAGAQVSVHEDAAAVTEATRLVVPGQGGFAEGAHALRGGIGQAIQRHIDADRPYFGICLGMQLLFESSEEAPGVDGLGVLPGTVVRLSPGTDPDDPHRQLKVPHMGWNVVSGSHPLLPETAWFYFVHSYRCAPEDKSLCVGVAEYGGAVCAAVARDRLFACQFHPEKSQDAGAALLKRFLEL